MSAGFEYEVSFTCPICGVSAAFPYSPICACGRMRVEPFEDPGVSREELLEPDDPEHVEKVRQIMADNDTPLSDWKPTRRTAPTPDDAQAASPESSPLGSGGGTSR